MARTAASGARDRVLSAARGLFSARGVRAVGMQEIIGTVGTGKNLLYREFPGKADLVRAHLDAARGSVERRIREDSPGLGARRASG